MSDKLEALRLEAETLASLMHNLANDDIGNTSFAVMSDLGENGTEHECDLDVGETALRAASVIDQLLAALEEKDQSIAELNVKLFDQSILLDAAISRAEAAGRREEHLKADVAVLTQRNKELESDVRVADGIIANHQELNAELQQRLQQPIKLPDLRKEISGERYVWSDGLYNYRTDLVQMLKEQGHKVEE
ncbi:hypothetical protein NJH77_21410 [Serratia fonticola]|uniref:hypothetical protein n=1 Tax=Serratia fonticola TaxID=47917 RepID=UPI002097C6AE|nr:hypothetical protein [Serratia fonticola]MCO7511812.1 hypothetical protein [Serratia fonticola]